MKFDCFWEFEKYYSVPYGEKKYEEALTLLKTASEYLTEEEYNKYKFNVLLDIARIYTEQKDLENCIKVIKEAQALGYYLPLGWTRFEFLKPSCKYPAIVEANEKLHKEAQENAHFEYEVHLPKDYAPNKKYPLFFCLHGDGSDGNIPNHSWYWKHELLNNRGFIFVYPQSSQVRCHNGFGWLIDMEKSRNEIAACYEELKKLYSVDESCVIVAGFSGGSNASIDIALHNAIPAKGFIALCPGNDLSDYNKEVATTAKARGLRGVIFEGEYELEPPVQDMLKEFDAANFPYEYIINKGIGHWYPSDLEEIVSKAIDFIIK